MDYIQFNQQFLAIFLTKITIMKLNFLQMYLQKAYEPDKMTIRNLGVYNRCIQFIYYLNYYINNKNKI